MRPVALAALIALSSAGASARQCYRLAVEPPRYSTVAEQVMVAPERQVEELAPAVTREVEETVVVRPERTVTRIVPARYADESQTVETSPAHREWRTRNEDGEVIGCWVNVPARYASITRRVLVEAAREVSQTIPAETVLRTRTEIVEPAHSVTRTIPARYETRTRQALVSAGGARWAPLNNCAPE